MKGGVANKTVTPSVIVTDVTQPKEEERRSRTTASIRCGDAARGEPYRSPINFVMRRTHGALRRVFSRYGASRRIQRVETHKVATGTHDEHWAFCLGERGLITRVELGTGWTP